MNHEEHMASAIQSIRQAYQTRSAHENDLAWLSPLRDRAIESFSKSGFPTLRDEDWKYTNLRPLAEASGAMMAASRPIPDTGAIAAILTDLPISDDDAMIVFANGAYVSELSRVPATDAGIVITTLADTDAPQQTRLIDKLGSLASIEKQQLTALNTAFMTDGLCIDIEAGAKIDNTIHVIFVSDDPAFSPQPRLLINAGERSRAVVFEHHLSQQASWTNAVTEIHCEPAANLSYVKIQNENDTASHSAIQHVRLDADSSFQATHLDLGAQLARNDLVVEMQGQGSHAELYGLFLADGNRHVDNHTRIDHVAKNATSRENYRGILNDSARAVFNGKIIVHDGADGTDAQMNNRNLLLTNTAEIDTKPELEIYTDEVKCAHGATTGQIDDNALFYLRSRGISAELARRLLVLAFAREITDQIAIRSADLAEYINRSIEQRLPE